jgi:hypothetical protein
LFIVTNQPIQWSRVLLEKHVSESKDLKTNLNFKLIKSSKMRWLGHVGQMGEMRNAYKILVSILECPDDGGSTCL